MLGADLLGLSERERERGDRERERKRDRSKLCHTTIPALGFRLQTLGPRRGTSKVELFVH
jgi:hypothetical protein